MWQSSTSNTLSPYNKFSTGIPLIYETWLIPHPLENQIPAFLHPQRATSSGILEKCIRASGSLVAKRHQRVMVPSNPSSLDCIFEFFINWWIWGNETKGIIVKSMISIFVNKKCVSCKVYKCKLNLIYV